MYIDIIVGIIIFFSILTGIKKGFFFEIISFFVLVLNIVLAKKITPLIYTKFIGELTLDENLVYYIIYFGVLFALYLVTSLLMGIVKNVLPKMFPGILDNILGGILGFLKGSFLIFVLLLIFNLFTGVVPQIKQYSKSSFTNKIFLNNVGKLEKYYPEVIQQKIDDLTLKIKINDLIKKHLSN